MLFASIEDRASQLSALSLIACSTFWERFNREKKVVTSSIPLVKESFYESYNCNDDKPELMY